MRKTFFSVVLAAAAISVGVLFPIAIGRAQDLKESRDVSRIEFNDQSHGAFFRHQAFLVRHGKPAETRQSWAQLPTPVQSLKIRDGERLLESLKAELEKKSRSPEEEDLWQSVWPAMGPSAVPDVSRAVTTREGSVPTEVAKGFTNRIEPFKSAGNWGKLFDGGQSGRQAGELVVAPTGRPAAGGYQDHQAQRLRPSAFAIDRRSVPAVPQPQPTGSSNSLPLLVGSALFAVSYLSLRVVGRRASEFPKTNALAFDELGRVVLPEGVRGPEDAPLATGKDDKKKNSNCFPPPPTPMKDCMCPCIGAGLCSCPPPLSTCPVQNSTCPLIMCDCNA